MEKTGNKLLECVKKEKVDIMEHRVKVVGMVKRRYTDDVQEGSWSTGDN